MNLTFTIASGIAAALCAVAADRAPAQAYPARPIRAVVGFATGGQIDAITRIVAVKMSDAL